MHKLRLHRLPLLCEYTGKDTTDNDNDQKKARDRIKNSFYSLAGCDLLSSFYHITFFLCIKESYYHTAECPEKSRDPSGHEQCCNGSSAACCGIYNE